MFKAFVFLTLVAACTCQSGKEITGTQISPGLLKLNFIVGDTDNDKKTNNGSIGVEYTAGGEFAKFGHVCTTAGGNACKQFTCTSFDTCQLVADGAIITPSIANYTYTFDRSMAPLNKENDRGYVIGENKMFYAISPMDTITNESIAKGGWASGIFTITQFIGIPTGLTLAMEQSDDDVLMTFSSETSKPSQYSVGWKQGSNTWPTWAASCNPNTTSNEKYCIFVNCRAFNECTIADDDDLFGGKLVKHTDKVAVVSRKAVGPADFTIASGEQNNMLYYIDDAVDNKDPAAITAVNKYGWAKFGTAPVVHTKPDIKEPTFPVSVTEDKENVKLSVTTNKGKYAMVGFNDGVALYPTFVTVCEPASQKECGVYTCKSLKQCTDVKTSSTVYVKQTRIEDKREASITFSKSLITGNTPYIYWVEHEVPKDFKMAPALAIDQEWFKYFIETKPDFKTTFTRDTDTTIVTKITPGTGKGVFLGWRSGADATYPTDAFICAPSTKIAKCLDVSCKSASECAARPAKESIITKNIVNEEDKTATVTRRLKGGVTLGNHEEMYLVWDLIDTPADTEELDPKSLEDRKTWKYYQLPVPNLHQTVGNSACTYVPSIFAVVLALLYVLA